MALDSTGNLYVADDSVQTIRKITAAGVVTTFAGAGNSSGTTDGVSNAARFASPHDVAIDVANKVYVADSGNSTIRKISSGGAAATIAGVRGVGYFNGVLVITSENSVLLAAKTGGF